MSQNSQEITEAKLASYIDGELGSTERAEIEALLQRKPQYRPLLDELRRTRELLRALPRESAPPELAEAFNSQLERSVLLDGPEDLQEPRVPAGAWPRVLAIAAIITLMLGLAAAVFFALPNHKLPMVASSASPNGIRRYNSLPASRGADDDESGTASQRDAANDIVPAGGATQPAFGRASGLESSMAARNSSGKPDALQELAQNISQTPQVQQLLETQTPQLGAPSPQNRAGQLAPAQKSPDNARVILVRSANTNQVRVRLAEFLTQNNIRYQVAPGAAGLDAAQGWKGSGEAGQRGFQQSPGTPAATREEGGAQQAFRRNQELSGGSRRPAEGEPPPPGTATSNLAKHAAASSSQQTPAQLSQQMQSAPRMPSAEMLYVARGLSREQVRELADCLSRDGEVRQVELARGESSYGFMNNSLGENNNIIGRNSASADNASGPSGATGDSGVAAANVPESVNAKLNDATSVAAGPPQPGPAPSRAAATPNPDLRSPSGGGEQLKNERGSVATAPGALTATQPTGTDAQGAAPARGRSVDSRDVRAGREAADEDLARRRMASDHPTTNATSSGASSDRTTSAPPAATPETPQDVVIVVEGESPATRPAPTTQPATAPAQ